MLRLLLAAALPLTLACVVVTTTADTEPPLRLAVELDGKTFEAEPGKQIEVEVGGKKVTLRVLIQPTRRFASAGITFEYPSSMSYAFSADDGLDMWTLDGDACILMVQRLDAGEAEGLAKIVLDGIVEDSDASKREPLQVQLGSKKVKALRCKVDHGEYSETWTAFGVDVQGRSIVLLLQEMLDEDDEDNASATERQAILDLLAKTFTIAK